MANNFCSECGNKLREDFKVCPYCGKKIIKESKYKYCHVCGSPLNEEGKCDNCSVVVEVVEQVKEEPKKINVCALLSFIFALTSVFFMMVSSELPDGIISDILFFLFLILAIAGFVLQFFGRKNASTISKVFSWIAFGITVFILLIIVLAFFGTLIDEISMGGITDF